MNRYNPLAPSLADRHDAFALVPWKLADGKIVGVYLRALLAAGLV